MDSGASFMDVVQYLSEVVSPLRPIDFLRIFQEDLGISFVRARDVPEYFGPDMRPIADESLINSLGREILMLRPRAGSGGDYPGRRSRATRAGLPPAASYYRRFGRNDLGRPGAPVVGIMRSSQDPDPGSPHFPAAVPTKLDSEKTSATPASWSRPTPIIGQKTDKR